MPGSVIADRGDQAAVDDARDPALLLLLVAVLEEVREADVVVEGDAEDAAGHAGIRALFDDDLVEAEVFDAESAVLLRGVHRQHVLLAGLGEQLARYGSFLFPLLEVGSYLVGDEASYAFAEVIVFRFKNFSVHRPNSI